jgi:predicted metalloprotease with PDZ domain
MVDYEVTIDAHRLELRVTMTLTGDLAEGDIRLEIPSWVPGDYEFEPYARDLFNLRAHEHGTEEELRVTREGYSSFLVHGGRGNVVVTYRAVASEIDFGEACGIVDSQYAIVLGTRYLHSPAHVGRCRVSYRDLPDGWRIHHPSGAERVHEHTWVYPSFEILLDTPVVFGHFDLLRREVEGTEFFFAFVDRGVGFEDPSEPPRTTKDAERFADKVAQAAAVMHGIFGEFPFENYTFVLTLNPDADWGLEHLTSTMCGLGPDVFVDDEQFAIGIRVCAHELFHAWNVRRLRPDPLGELQYHLLSGSFTEGLWVAEGFTRYYEFLISTRVGAYDAEQFLSAVVGYYEHLTAEPAYRRVSATDSSLATYLNHSKYAGRVNNAIDYYDKGMLIAFATDVALRLNTDSQSLDTAFAAFYNAYVGINETPGYTTADVVDFFNEVLPGLGDALGRMATRPGNLETPDQLRALGFEVQEEEQNYLGIFFLNDSQPSIYGLADTSPAGEAGLAPGDVITQVNGYHYTQAALWWAARNPMPVTLQVLRGHRELSFTVQPGRHRRITGLVWQGNAEQQRVIQRWLAPAAFDPEPGQFFSVDFYENFHGIETLV